ncbi:MAG: LytTR family DNA-binding domain-containing protein [Bacteroidota bacterium]
MKVLIIEDEAPAFRRLQKILEDTIAGVEIVDVIDSVEEAVKWFRNHQAPDLTFMDIQLNDGISFEIFDQIEIQSPIIFTTAFDEYMLKAFKVNSIDYLLKPIKQEELEKSIAKYHRMRDQFGHQAVDMSRLLAQIQGNTQQYKSRFLVKQGEKLISVETDHIGYFYTKNGVVHMVTDQGRNYLMDQTLEDIYASLDPQKYYRANRQFIVGFDAIASVERYFKSKLIVELNPKSADEVIISAEKASEFKKWLGQ